MGRVLRKAWSLSTCQLPLSPSYSGELATLPGSPRWEGAQPCPVTQPQGLGDGSYDSQGAKIAPGVPRDQLFALPKFLSDLDKCPV